MVHYLIYKSLEFEHYYKLINTDTYESFLEYEGFQKSKNISNCTFEPIRFISVRSIPDSVKRSFKEIKTKTGVSEEDIIYYKMFYNLENYAINFKDDNNQLYFLIENDSLTILTNGDRIGLYPNFKYIFSDNEIIELDLSKYLVDNLSSFGSFFSNNKNLIRLDLSTLNLSYITDYRLTFFNNFSLEEVIFNSAKTYPYKVASMFDNCKSLKFVDLHNFDFRRTYTMSAMFSGSGLINIELNNIDDNTDISELCYNCKNLESITLNRHKVENPSFLENLDKLRNNMFFGCDNLKQINGDFLNETK